MNPLDALSALTHAQGAGATGGINFQPTSPTTTGAPIGEAFQNLLQPMTATPASATTATPANALSNINAPSMIHAPSGIGPTNWGHMAQQMVMAVNSKQQTAAALVNDVLKGGSTPVHEAMVATEEASLSFEFLAEARNKIVEAYQQVMQMQV